MLVLKTLSVLGASPSEQYNVSFKQVYRQTAGKIAICKNKIARRVQYQFNGFETANANLILETKRKPEMCKKSRVIQDVAYLVRNEKQVA